MLKEKTTKYQELVRQLYGEEITTFLESNAPYLYLKSLPIQELMENGVDEESINLFLLALGASLGEVFSYSTHRDGKLVFDIYPVKADSGEQLGTGTKLDWHTDDAHAPDQCDFICLLCLQGDPNALTLVTNPDWFMRVKPETQKTLMENLYTIRPDKSYHGAEPLVTPPIKQDDAGVIELRYDPEFTEAPDETAQKALLSLETVFAENSTAIEMESGDFMVVNNKVAAHARSNFAPAYERGKDRWLKRVIVRKQLAAAE
ncbi:MAG: TauD/TfdA family dioxygenase [bacterium]|nr:TauD/TfdA family dioxygenase [bacterium]